METLKRIRAATVERRLLNTRGEPNFNVRFYVLNARGEHAGVALYAREFRDSDPHGHEKAVYAVCTENGAEDHPLEPLLPGSPNA